MNERLAIWVIFSEVDILKYYSYYFFFQKTGFDISRKLSPMKTVCMKFQILFPGKNKKKHHQFIVCWFSRQKAIKVNFKRLCIWLTIIDVGCKSLIHERGFSSLWINCQIVSLFLLINFISFYCNKMHRDKLRAAPEETYLKLHVCDKMKTRALLFKANDVVS